MISRQQAHLLDGRRAGARYAFTAPRSTSAGLAGAHLARRPGSSLEFMDHRDYQPGDDLRRIDWSAYARNDRLSIKLFREEVNPHVDLLIDGSRSMALEGSGKSAAALALAAALATAAGNSGFTHAAWLGGGQWTAVPDGRRSPETWQGIDFEHRGSLAEPFHGAGGLWPARSTRVFLSDLLWFGEPEAAMAPLAAGAARVVIVQVLAEADVEPPGQGNIRLEDSETGEQEEVFVDAAARRRYREALSLHQENWHRAARQVGGVMVTIVAERFLRDWSLDALLAAGVLKVA